MLNHIASKEGLKHRDKRFAVDYVQVTSVLGNAGPYSYACFPGEVPAKLDGKAKKEIQLRVGDDVAAARILGTPG